MHIGIEKFLSIFGIDTELLNGHKLLSLDHFDSVSFLIDHKVVLLAFNILFMLLYFPLFIVILHLTSKVFLIRLECLSSLIILLTLYLFKSFLCSYNLQKLLALNLCF